LHNFAWAALVAVVGSAAIASDWVEDKDTQSFRITPKSPAEYQAPVHTHSPTDTSGNSRPRKVLPLQGNVAAEGTGETEGLEASADRFVENAPTAPYPNPKNVGAGTFKAWLQATHPGLTQNSKDSIVEVKGQWDDSGHILHNFGLSFTKISPNALPKYDLGNAAVMIVDCAGNLNQEALDAVRSFVLNGGYLITTDWALDNCVVRVAPGFLEWDGGYSYPDTVDAVIVSSDPELTAGCAPTARWKLDDKCQIARVRRAGSARVLVRSKMLVRSDPDGKGILAATFDYGKGKVLHVVGHFDNNSTGAFNTTLPDPAPNMGISLRQGIITNFIVMGLKAHPQPSANVADKGEAPDEPKKR
jgi:hypothetical protein